MKWWRTKGHLTSIIALMVLAIHRHLSYFEFTIPRWLWFRKYKKKIDGLLLCFEEGVWEKKGASKLCVWTARRVFYEHLHFCCSENWSGLSFLTWCSYLVVFFLLHSIPDCPFLSRGIWCNIIILGVHLADKNVSLGAVWSLCSWILFSSNLCWLTFSLLVKVMQMLIL